MNRLGIAVDPRASRSSILGSLATLALAAGLLGACGGGGGGGSPTTPGPMTVTQTFTGTARANGPTSCSGESHAFTAAEGAVTVTLVQSTGGTALVAQVCAGGIDDNNCTINQTPVTVGQTLSSTRRGGSGQNLTLLPLNCGGGGPVPPGPVQYTATVTFQR